MAKGNMRPVKLNAKNQLKVGYHSTTAPESALKEGDTLLPAAEHGGRKRTAKALGNHTYFATDEEGAWNFSQQILEQESEDRQGNRKAAPRTRVFTTAPSQDQSLDPNYIREKMEGYKRLQEWGQRPPGIRGMINHVRQTGHRVASSQTILSQQFGPPAPTGGRTDISLAGPNGRGGDLNWHEYGHSNWVKHFPDGQTIDSLGTYNSIPKPQEPEGSAATNDWKKGTLGKDGKIVSRPKPLVGDQKLPLGDEWTKDPEPEFWA